MKKVLMLVSDTKSQRKTDFVKLVGSHFGNKTSIELEGIHSIYLHLKKGHVVLEMGGKSIKSYNLVLFRGIKAKDQSLATAISLVLKKLKIRFIDSIYGEVGPSENKLVSLVKLFTGDVPLPESVYYSGEPSENLYEKLVSVLGSPFVAKDLWLQRGKGVFLIDSLKEYKRLKGNCIFQRYIKKSHEYRVLTLGNKVGVYEEKIAENGEFRNNVALGAREVFLDKNKTPKKIKKISIKAAKLMKLEIAGVDVVEDENGILSCLEVNRGPGLTYDENISPEFREIAEFIEKHANTWNSF